MNPRECTTFQELTTTFPQFYLGGWMADAEREELFRLAKTLDATKCVMEIGVFGGTTLSLFAIMSDCRVIGLDSFESDTPCDSPVDGRKIDVRTLCHEQLAINGVADRVKIVDASSHAVGPTWDTPVDLLIVDGDHSYEGATQDLRDFAPWVLPGGLLIVDDYWSIGDVRAAVDGWLSGEPPGRWIAEYGITGPTKGSGGTLSHKMRSWRRTA